MMKNLDSLRLETLIPPRELAPAAKRAQCTELARGAPDLEEVEGAYRLVLRCDAVRDRELP